nr:histone H4 [Ipomoea batatas]
MSIQFRTKFSFHRADNDVLIHKIRSDEHPIAHNSLASETVQSPALPLEGVDDVHRRHGLPPSVLSVGHGVSDHILEEDFEDSPGLLVDEAGDTLHASSTSQTANGRLGDPLDVVAKHLPVTLGSSLAQSLASLSTAGHFCRVKEEI